jgi:hypothetical protein
MAASKVTVKQPETPIPTEVLAQSILEISQGMARLRAGKLNEKALLLLLSHSSGVAQRDVKLVLWALDSLANTYLKKPVR